MIKLIYRYRSCEVWARYDPTADLYELFASSDADDPIGEADTITDAKKFAKQYCLEQYET